MTGVRKAAITAGLSLCALVSLHAQDSTFVTIDFSSRKITAAFSTSRDGRETCSIPARDRGELGCQSLTLRPSNPTRIVLQHFNTALFDVTVSTSDIESPDIDQYKDLLKELKPYAGEVPIILNLLPKGKAFPPTLSERIANWRDSLAYLGTVCLWKVRALSLLDSLTKSEIASTQQFAASYLTTSDRRPRLRYLEYISALYDSLATDRNREEVGELTKQSQELLSKAHKLEAVLIRLYRIDNSLELTLDKQPSWKTGVKATVSISSSEVLKLADLDTVSAKFEITLLPHPVVRPISAVSIIYWAGEDFQKFSAEKQQNGYIVSASKDDVSPFTQALTFGVSWGFLDFRDVEDKGIALSAPELIVNPFDAFKGIGLGVSASCTFVKLSVGALWIKNTILDGKNVGDPLDDPSALKTMPVYRPRFFVGVGIYNISF
jgi:hypothetical protein